MLEVSPEHWPIVELGGARYAVAPRYIGGVALGEALAYANFYALQLPTRALVDAIWKAADCKLDAGHFAITDHDGTPATMASRAVLAAQAKRVQAAIAAWEKRNGAPAVLVAGTHKDVVQEGGRLGIYGWHRLDGTTVQGPGVSFRHDADWVDYSQGCRLIKRLDG